MILFMSQITFILDQKLHKGQITLNRIIGKFH